MFVDLAHPLYLIFGSIVLGYVAFMVARWLARWLGKREDAQFVMLLGMIVTTVGFAISFKLSVLLALLAQASLVLGATFTVVNTLETGTGSLRPSPHPAASPATRFRLGTVQRPR